MSRISIDEVEEMCRPTVMSDTNAVLKSLYVMKERYSDIVDDINYICDNEEYPLLKMIEEVENNTEIGQKFVIEVTRMILVYMSRFDDELANE